jgi:hypothetical protein
MFRILGALGLLAERNLFHATPTVSREHGVCSVIAPFYCLLQQARDTEGLTRIPTLHVHGPREPSSLWFLLRAFKMKTSG